MQEVITVPPCSNEQEVKNLLSELQRIKTKKELAVGSLKLQIQDLEEELEQQSRPFDQESKAIEAGIKELMLAVGHTVKTEQGAANWRSGSVRVTYDYKALDAIEDESIQDAICKHRKETTVSPSVTVEVY